MKSEKLITTLHRMYNQDKSSPLKEKSFLFAVDIVKLISNCNNDWKFSAIYKQLLKSGTSIGANISEAEFAQSPADFVSKMTIALKEANETKYWLKLFRESNIISEENYIIISSKCKELISMLVKSIKTVKQRYDL